MARSVGYVCDLMFFILEIPASVFLRFGYGLLLQCMRSCAAKLPA